MKFNGRSARALPWLAPVALAALLPGCDLFPQQTCTLIGCTSAIELLLPDTHSSAYTATFESPVVSGSVECVPPSTDDESARWSERSFTGDLSAQGPAVATVACDANRLSLQFFDSDPKMPEELRVSIDGEHAHEQTFTDIAYTVSRPNGPECLPVCNQTELTLAP